MDEEYRAVIQLLANSMMDHPDTVERDLHLIWVARSLERIGDHAKNISEYVLYLVEGKDIRHLPKGTFGTLKPDKRLKVPNDAPTARSEDACRRRESTFPR